MAFEKLNRLLIEKDFLDMGFLTLLREGDFIYLEDLEPFTEYVISRLPEGISTQYKLNQKMETLKNTDKYLWEKNKFISSDVSDKY